MPTNVRAVPIVPSSAAPMSVPTRVPRPPVIAAPPTTTAATAFNSSPMPALLGTAENRTAFKSAANPVSAPINTKTPKTTRRGSMPASRAASASDPTA